MTTSKDRQDHQYEKPSQGAHTPGPWLQCGEDGTTIYALHDNGFGFWSGGKRQMVNRFSCHVDACLHQGGSLEEAKANARLIAAAPTMHDYVVRRAVAGDIEAQQILGALNASR